MPPDSLETMGAVGAPFDWWTVHHLGKGNDDNVESKKGSTELKVQNGVTRKAE